MGKLFKGLYFFQTYRNQVEVSVREFRDVTESPKEGWQGRTEISACEVSLTQFISKTTLCSEER